MKQIAFLLALSCICACTHSVHQVSVSGFEPVKRGIRVKGYAERVSILGFNGDNLFVDRAVEDLESKCKKGKIVGITMEHLTSHGLFHWTDKIYLKGHCLR